MLIINNEIQIQEGNEIYEREYLTRGARRTCIQIEIPKQDDVTYETLVNTFSDGASIIRQLKETRLETREVKQETTTSDTSDVTTLDDFERGVPLLTLSEDAVVDFEESSNPNTRFPTTVVVRKIPLETTPNKIAKPTTATVRIKFLCGFFSFFK